MDFTLTRQKFALPDGLIYMDGNSLGPLPKAALARTEHVLEKEWGHDLIASWKKNSWMTQPVRVGDKIAPLLGAAAGSIVAGDTLSIKIYQAVAAALDLHQKRSTTSRAQTYYILSDHGNFPTDLYMVRALLDHYPGNYQLKLVAPEEVADAIDQTDNLAVLLLTHVDYRTGRMHDMEDLTRQAHQAGALTIWDLAHSAGAVPLDLAGCQTDFAAGCCYKYLNGGPGAPAFIYVRPDHIAECQPILAGWLGHAAPFDFDPSYVPAPSIDRFRVGTPPVVQMSILEEALDLWAGVDMQKLRICSIELSERFITRVRELCPDLTLVSPRDPDKRGSQVCFRHERAGELIDSLAEKGVVGDFRPPDILRFGITPLYLGEEDIDRAATILADLLWTKEPA